MGHQTTFHAPHGGADFLGWRKRAGETEIVYDDGVTRRMVFRVASSDTSEARISEALRVAVGARRIIPTLYDELKNARSPSRRLPVNHALRQGFPCLKGSPAAALFSVELTSENGDLK